MLTENQHTAASARAESFEYDDRTVIAVDLGAEVDPTVEVVDGTAILVVDGDQHEFDLPAGAERGVNKNGVVTFEVHE
ncbi:MAG: hypothetical protein ABEI11_04175 [Haloarculaceae archaeon]